MPPPSRGGFLGLRGADQLRAVGRDLRFAGSPAGLRRSLRSRIRASAQPIIRDVKANALAIPADGPASMGSLRQALARSTRVRTRFSSRSALVRIETAGERMPQGQRSLPTLMEGQRRWRHPVFGNRQVWVDQASHPYFRPAVEKNLPGVAAAVMTAVDETAIRLAAGHPKL